MFVHTVSLDPAFPGDPHVTKFSWELLEDKAQRFYADDLLFAANVYGANEEQKKMLEEHLSCMKIGQTVELKLVNVTLKAKRVS